MPASNSNLYSPAYIETQFSVKRRQTGSSISWLPTEVACVRTTTTSVQLTGNGMAWKAFDHRVVGLVYPKLNHPSQLNLNDGDLRWKACLMTFNSPKITTKKFSHTTVYSTCRRVSWFAIAMNGMVSETGRSVLHYYDVYFESEGSPDSKKNTSNGNNPKARCNCISGYIVLSSVDHQATDKAQGFAAMLVLRWSSQLLSDALLMLHIEATNPYSRRACVGLAVGLETSNLTDLFDFPYPFRYEKAIAEGGRYLEIQTQSNQ